MRITGNCGTAGKANKRITPRRPEKSICCGGEWVTTIELVQDIEAGYKRFCERRGLPYSRRPR